MSDKFTAAPQALGYFFQARLALLLLLRKGRDDPDAEVSIERFDDVVFHTGGSPAELIQAKHHVGKAGALTNQSADLWKTLRVWSTRIADALVEPEHTVFTILTTAVAPVGSAAAMLRSRDRNVSEALQQLRQVADSETNKENTPAYTAFKSLTAAQQLSLLDSVQVLDCSSNILDCSGDIARELRRSARPQHTGSLQQRLEGWWFQRVIDHLSDKSIGTITDHDLQSKLNELQDQFQQDNLPIDFGHEVGQEVDEEAFSQRVFVEQLHMIAVLPRRIRSAILDYYRAYHQRSRWVRELLLLDNELENYDRRLVDEWSRHHDRMIEDLGLVESEDELRLKGQLPAEGELQRTGRQLFNWSDDAQVPIRYRCIEQYVSRGTFQILADRRDIGWHPYYKDRLRSPQVTTVAVGGDAE